MFVAEAIIVAKECAEHKCQLHSIQSGTSKNHGCCAGLLYRSTKVALCFFCLPSNHGQCGSFVLLMVAQKPWPMW